MITIKAIETKAAELKELESLAKELDNEIEAIRAELKAELVERNAEALTARRFIIRFTAVKTTRFDTAAFKAKLPELYSVYTKQVESRRFTIS